MALFGFLKKEKQEQYYLMDKDSHFLGKGTVQHREDNVIQFKLQEGNTDDVLRAEILQVIPMNDKTSTTMGRITDHRGNNFTIEPMRDMGTGVRKNFRMPVDFESFIYPDEGGRYIIKSIDLSCGGIAFYSIANLKAGSQMEVVIPITADGPLIVRCTALRVMPFSPPIQKYACQFVDMIQDQENMIQEAVFSIQLAQIRDSGRR